MAGNAAEMRVLWLTIPNQLRLITIELIKNTECLAAVTTLIQVEH